MFQRKNSFVKFEILPDGNFFVDVNINPKSDPNRMVEMLSRIFNKDFLENTMACMVQNAIKVGNAQQAKYILDKFTEYQRQLYDQTHTVVTKRKPLIRPSQVFRVANPGLNT